MRTHFVVAIAWLPGLRDSGQARSPAIPGESWRIEDGGKSLTRVSRVPAFTAG